MCSSLWNKTRFMCNTYIQPAVLTVDSSWSNVLPGLWHNGWRGARLHNGSCLQGVGGQPDSTGKINKCLPLSWERDLTCWSRVPGPSSGSGSSEDRLLWKWEGHGLKLLSSTRIIRLFCCRLLGRTNKNDLRESGESVRGSCGDGGKAWEGNRRFYWRVLIL